MGAIEIRELKVLLRQGNHHAYDSMLSHPPKGVSYCVPKLVSRDPPGVLRKIARFFKVKLYLNALRILNEPMKVFLHGDGFDLIHSCGGILPIGSKPPYVVDIEHVQTFVSFEPGRLEKVKPKLEKALQDRKLKKILCWSKACKTSVENALSVDLSDKLEVVHPAVEVPEFEKKDHDGINILFVGSAKDPSFYQKGGKETVLAFKEIEKEYDARLTVIAKDVSPSFKERFNSNKTTFLEYVPHEVLYSRLYPSTDIFVMPTYYDSWGLTIQEAMSFGIPVVSTRVLAVPEIVGDAGILIDKPALNYYNDKQLFAWSSWVKFGEHIKTHSFPETVAQLREAMVTLIESPSLRRKLGRRARERVEKGQVSIPERNKRLLKHYEEAIE